MYIFDNEINMTPEQDSANEWALDCVKCEPAARLNQEVGITRNILLQKTSSIIILNLYHYSKHSKSKANPILVLLKKLDVLRTGILSHLRKDKIKR